MNDEAILIVEMAPTNYFHRLKSYYLKDSGRLDSLAGVRADVKHKRAAQALFFPILCILSW